MAWTINIKKKTVMGDMRVHLLSCSADAATQTVLTGLKNVVAFQFSPVSMTTDNVKVYVNSNASGVQSFGVLGCSGFASGDEFFITIFGN